MLDINIEENKKSNEKVIINPKAINPQSNYTTIKCYHSLPKKTSIESRGVNLIKIHKTVYLNLPNLTHIDLRDNKLLKLSKNFKLFKNLTLLRLDNNQLTYLPSFISEFTQLEELSISHNFLSSLPSSIQYLSSLKVLKFSCNKITEIPIEFGMLKELKCLHIDSNYFTEIPTTLCFLRHLDEFSFEWLEFLDPPYTKVLKDEMGKSCILKILTTMQEMVKNSILFCDYNTFMNRFSTNNDETKKFTNINRSCNLSNNNNINSFINKKKLFQIFSALESNYYSVVKSLLFSSQEYFTAINNENKTPFYIAIHNKNDDIINLFLSKIDFSKIPSSHVFIHKAIRMRNPELVKKLISMGISINSTDDQGSGCFHVLFSSFTKQLTKCALIGDFLLENGAYLNSYSNDKWAPVHIAARRGSKECLLWIINVNRKRKRENKELFDLNLQGRNKWTPLHLTVNAYRLEETMVLIENGCDVFARNTEKKTPKHVSNGNYLFTKLLTHYERMIMGKKYKLEDRELNEVNEIGNGNINSNFNDMCYTAVDGKKEELQRAKTNVFGWNFSIGNFNFREHSEIGNNSSRQIFIPTFQTMNFMELNKSNERRRNLGDKEENENKLLKKNYTVNPLNFLNLKEIENNKGNKVESIEENYNHNHNILNNNINNKLNKFFKEFAEFKSNNDLKDKTPFITFLPNESLNYEEIYNKIEILSTSDSSLYERYEAFKSLRLYKYDIINYIKKIIENIDLESSVNLVILSEICNYCIINSATQMKVIFTQLESNIFLEKRYTYIIKELKSSIEILWQFDKSNYDKLPMFNREVPNDKTVELMQGINVNTKNEDNLGEMFNNSDDDDIDEYANYDEEDIKEVENDNNLTDPNETNRIIMAEIKKGNIRKVCYSMDMQLPFNYFKEDSMLNDIDEK